MRNCIYNYRITNVVQVSRVIIWLNFLFNHSSMHNTLMHQLFWKYSMKTISGLTRALISIKLDPVLLLTLIIEKSVWRHPEWNLGWRLLWLCMRLCVRISLKIFWKVCFLFVDGSVIVISEETIYSRPLVAGFFYLAGMIF